MPVMVIYFPATSCTRQFATFVSEITGLSRSVTGIGTTNWQEFVFAALPDMLVNFVKYMKYL